MIDRNTTKDVPNFPSEQHHSKRIHKKTNFIYCYLHKRILKRCQHFFFGSWFKIIFLFVPLAIITSFVLLTTIKVYHVYRTWEMNHELKLQKSLYYYQSISKKVFPDAYHRYPMKRLLNNLEMYDIGLITIVYDVHGKEIGRFAKQERSLVGLQHISPYFIRSLLAVEDKRFYQHDGVDYLAICRAFIHNLLSFRIKEGGSTLTQQLCKLIFTDRARTIDRKIYELFMSWKLESFFDKNSILLMYVNYIHFGHNIDGVQEAAQFYFNKPASHLSLEESALLVGLISNPNHYSPFNNLETSKKRHWFVLNLLSRQGYFPSNELEHRFIQFWTNYKFERQNGFRKKAIQVNQSAYVMEEVKRRIIKQLSLQFDGNEQKAKNILYTHGWKIYTTIDLDLQLKAEHVVQDRLKWYRKLLSQKEELQILDLDKVQGALIAIEPSNGYIKSFVGGDGFRKNNQYNRVFQANRQPGSAFKPLFYLSVLDAQIVSPYTLRQDKYSPIPMKNGALWEVHNYKDRYLNKSITLTDALKISSNQITAQLASQVGIRRMREIVRDILGFSDEQAILMYPDEQYSSVLGSVAITPFNLAQLYMAIANRGAVVEPKLILQVRDMSDQVIDLFSAEDSISRTVSSKESAFQLIKMMQEIFEPGGTASHLKNESSLSFDIAAKSGTSQQSRDLWFAGFTPELVTVTWIGHDDDMPLYGAGGSIAGPMFAQFMNIASKKVLFSHFMFDESYQFHVQTICKDSGLIAIEGRCKRIDYSALFIRHSKTEPWDYCYLTHDEREKKDSLLLEYTPNIEKSPNSEQSIDYKEPTDQYKLLPHPREEDKSISIDAIIPLLEEIDHQKNY